MPIPTPLPKEQKGEFLQRCMMDDTMVREYKDQDQRYAICRNQIEQYASKQSKNIRGKK
jgi:hypothetical protein